MQKVLRDLDVAPASGGHADDDARKRMIADVAESAAIVQDETRRLGRITQGLLTGGDVVRAEIEGAVPLAAVVERARALVFAGMRRAPPVEIGDGVDRLSVVGDRDRLVQVMVNLLQNAYDAVREKQDGRVYVSARYDDADQRVSLIIEDDGPGIPASVRDRMFEPFATTKPPGEGTGLGLYTSYMLVRAMSGTIVLEDREGGGTRARVVLQAALEGAIRPPVPGRGEPKEALA
jgi:C4-dicarboxylate-specific signal transduction histidine kinase